MTTLKWLAAIAFVMALVCRFTLRQIAFGWATRVTPGYHRDVFSATLGVILFWVLIVLSATLALIGFLRNA